MAISVGKLPETPSAYVIRDTKYKIKPKHTPKKILNNVPPCRWLGGIPKTAAIITIVINIRCQHI